MGKRRNPKDPPKEHQFKPGNPGGSAPKGKRISTWMLELGQLDELPNPKTLPINGRIALARIKASLGKMGERSTEIILDRTEGSVEKTVNIRDGIVERMTPEEKKEAFKIGLENQDLPEHGAGC